MSALTVSSKPKAISFPRSTSRRELGTTVSRLATTILAIFGLFFLSGALGFGLYGLTYADRVYQGVSIAGLDVSGMTESEARSSIAGAFARYLDQPVVLSSNGVEFHLVPSQSGVSLDIDATVDRAFAVGRSGSLWTRTQDWASTFLNGTELPAVLTVDQRHLELALTALAPEIISPPSNAFVDMEASGTPNIVPEVPGVAFDVTTTAASVAVHLSGRGKGAVAVVTRAVPPSVLSGDLHAQLAQVQSTVDSPLTVSGVGLYWAVSPTDLKRIIAVEGGNGAVQINRTAVTDLVTGIAHQIEHDPINAKLIVNNQGNLAVVPSEQSIDVNIAKSVDVIVQALEAGAHDVVLTIDRRPPAISDAQAQTALERAQTLVAQGLTVTWSDGSARLGSADLIAALTIESRPGEPEPIAIGLSREVIGQLLEPIAEQIDIAASNGRYRLVDGKVKLVEKGSNGRKVDIDASTVSVIGAVIGGQPSAPLTIEKLTPAFSTADAKKIKLNDVLGLAYTYYGNSSDARRQNVERAVGLESGWLVAPGDTFSYFENIGKVDEKNGFVTGLGILSDGNGGITTGPVIGGGICQVSTTIFQSAFWAGLTIVDRTAHPYWLQTYGQPPTGMKGLDAMVNIEDELSDSIDLQFQNNTGNWIAIVIAADGEYVTSQILGTSPGWNVSVVDGAPTISNIVNPPGEMIYQNSPELPAGEEKQVESAQEGFDATVVRITTDKNGNVIDQFTLNSTYGPSYNRTLVGTGESA